MHQQILVPVFLVSDASCDVPVLRPVSSAAAQYFSFICAAQREKNEAVLSYGQTSPPWKRLQHLCVNSRYSKISKDEGAR